MRRIKALAALITAVTAGALAPGAHAALLTDSAPDCSAHDTAKVFRPWLDLADYVPGPNGALETTDGWSLSGDAGLVDGNEPFHVGSPGDSRSLRLGASSSATSGVACVGIEHPTIRFFAKSRNATLSSSLRVQVTFVGPLGLDMTVPIGSVLPTSGAWGPSPAFAVVANLLPLLPGRHTPVTFTFTPQGPGSWQVDDLYVDPWRNG